MTQRQSDIPLFNISSGTEAESLGIPTMMDPTGAATLVGPGTQPDSNGLHYMQMPKEMDTFDIPILPEADELARFPEVSALLEQLEAALQKRSEAPKGDAIRLDISDAKSGTGLGKLACSLLYQTLGEGEVAIRIASAANLRVQETVLAGVWWVQQLDADDQLERQWLEVGAIPQAVITDSFPPAPEQGLTMPELPEGLLNAGSVLFELFDKASANIQQPFEQPHVVNLSLLPFSVEDHAFLHQTLRVGPTVILSRGYGNCRISCSRVPGVWRIQYFNSTDQLILDTLEVIAVPQVACAAQEDLQDSAERLLEIHAAMKL